MSLEAGPEFRLGHLILGTQQRRRRAVSDKYHVLSLFGTPLVAFRVEVRRGVPEGNLNGDGF
ncbi:hypothetical protein KL950_005412, partial [Ogataea haglerorum]